MPLRLKHTWWNIIYKFNNDGGTDIVQLWSVPCLSCTLSMYNFSARLYIDVGEKF
jgi:hypothetical protein